MNDTNPVATMAMFMLRLSGLLTLHNDTTQRQHLESISSIDSNNVGYHGVFDFNSYDDSQYDENFWSNSILDISKEDSDYLSEIIQRSSSEIDDESQILKEKYLTPVASPLVSSVPNHTAKMTNLTEKNTSKKHMIENAKLLLPSNITQGVFTNDTILGYAESADPSDIEQGFNVTYIKSRTESYTTERIINTASTKISGASENFGINISAIDNVSSSQNLNRDDLLHDDSVSISDFKVQNTTLDDEKESLAQSSYEYYDFSSQHESKHINTPLTSHSLVSPVPYPKLNTNDQVPTIESPGDGVHLSTDSTLIQSDISNNDVSDIYTRKEIISVSTEIKERKVIRPVPVNSISSGRNNPYPYGPMFLPGYTGTSSNFNDVQSRPRQHVSTTSTTTTASLQPAGEQYEYEYEAYDYKENIQKVKTETPPVLFHFNGPGYFPEAPSTTPPAV